MTTYTFEEFKKDLYLFEHVDPDLRNYDFYQFKDLYSNVYSKPVSFDLPEAEMQIAVADRLDHFIGLYSIPPIDQEPSPMFKYTVYTFNKDKKLYEFYSHTNDINKLKDVFNDERNYKSIAVYCNENDSYTLLQKIINE